MTHLFELKDSSVETIGLDNTTTNEVHLTVKFDHGPDAHYDRVLKTDLLLKDSDLVQYVCSHLSKLRNFTRDDFVDHISQYLDERLGLI